MLPPWYGLIDLSPSDVDGIFGPRSSRDSPTYFVDGCPFLGLLVKIRLFLHRLVQHRPAQPQPQRLLVAVPGQKQILRNPRSTQVVPMVPSAS